MKLQFAYTPSDKDVALQVKDKLQSLGYELTLLEDKPVDEEGVILALFTSDTKEEEFLTSLPWLAKQQEYSSIHYLKVMPFFVYHSRKEDPEEAFEGNAGELYDEVFSGEFKPYGWDLDSSTPETEFARVLENYSE